MLRATIPALALLFLSQFVHAQLPPRLKRCLPYPTFADEIAEARAEQKAMQPPPRAITVDRIRFHSTSPLPKPLQALLIDSIKTAPSKDYPGWLSELDGIRIVGPLQDRGYFRAEAHSTAQTLSENAETKHVALDVTIDTGLQYRIGSIEFRPAHPGEHLVFSDRRLRKCLRFRSGELLNVSKIRLTFPSLVKLYGSSGWIDFTPTPQFRIDDSRKRIDITLDLDQGPHYRVGKVEFRGSDAAAEKLIRSELKVGQPFDGFFFKRFYATHKSILFPDASPIDDVAINRDAKTGIVSITVDFTTCPPDSE